MDEVGSIVSTTSVSKLLELGEAADNAAPTASRSTHARSTSKFTKALVRAAQEDLARLFGIADEPATAFGGDKDDGMVTVMDVAAGEMISKEMELQPALYYILSGSFVISQLQSVIGQVGYVNHCIAHNLCTAFFALKWVELVLCCMSNLFAFLVFFTIVFFRTSARDKLANFFSRSKSFFYLDYKSGFILSACILRINR